MSDELTARAIIAYHRSDKGRPDIVSSAVVECNGKRYVKLTRRDASPVIYRIRNTGFLVRLKKRYPRALVS